MPNLILTSSFHTVAQTLRAIGHLPEHAVVAFIPTAGDPYQERPWIDADRKALGVLGYETFDVDVKQTTAEQLARALAPATHIFVAGGNTTYLVFHAKKSGLFEVVRELVAEGRTYVGSSAGAILAGPTIEPFIPGDMADLPGGFLAPTPSALGLVDYVVLPHYPLYAAHNDKIAAAWSDRLRFEKLTDEEYRVV